MSSPGAGTRLLAAGRRLLTHKRAYGGGGSKHKFVEAHMNELPVPSGSWQQAYNEKQKGYNMVLGAGLVISTASVLTLTTSGIIFFNFSPPDSIE